jgi:DNA polymerase-3 subunit beta
MQIKKRNERLPMLKITCETAALATICQNVQRAAAAKSTLPALECILLRVQNDELILTGYDGDMGIQTRIPVLDAQEGALALSGKVLCEMLRRFEGEKVTIAENDRNTARITSGRTSYSICGLSAEEFPELPDFTGETKVEMPLQLLREMIRQTAFSAAAGSEAKAVHTGVRFALTSGALELAALDGFRLAIRKEPIAYEGIALSYAVPRKTVEEVRALDVAEDAQVTILSGKRHIAFDVGPYHVVSRLLDGEFMNYAAAIPAEFSGEGLISAKHLASAIERISLIILEKLKAPVRFHILPQEECVALSCSTALGSADDSVTAQLKGEDLEIGFNNRYLLDALRAADTEQVRLRYKSMTSPMLITPPDDERFMYMILPVRLRDN